MQTTKTDRREYKVPLLAPTLRLLYSGPAGLCDEPARLLPAGSTPIGRSLDGGDGIDLRDDERASRLHARLRVTDGPAPGSPSGSPATVSVHDESSKNGTFLNGYRVTSASLQDGDVLRIGNSLLLLRYEPARQTDAPIAELFGQAPAIRSLRSELARAALAGGIILLQGESGTGKELAARAIHHMKLAAGRKEAFIPVNCAAIPESLAESQLFGHVAGAFSDARSAHDGYFRAAHGGTLFLDEIGELPLGQQAKLLRALEDMSVTPVGGTRAIPCDVQVVAATHRPLLAAVQAAQFRGDLYARLAAFPIHLPALRDRREDILPLFARAWGTRPLRLLPELAEALLLYPWPFNVRELVNLVSYLETYTSVGESIDLRTVAARLNLNPDGDEQPREMATIAARPSGASNPRPSGVPLLPEPLMQPPIPREVLVRLLSENQGKITRVAQMVGRSRRQVRRWLEYYGLGSTAQASDS